MASPRKPGLHILVELSPHVVAPLCHTIVGGQTWCNTVQLRCHSGNVLRSVREGLDPDGMVIQVERIECLFCKHLDLSKNLGQVYVAEYTSLGSRLYNLQVAGLR